MPKERPQTWLAWAQQLVKDSFGETGSGVRDSCSKPRSTQASSPAESVFSGLIGIGGGRTEGETKEELQGDFGSETGLWSCAPWGWHCAYVWQCCLRSRSRQGSHRSPGVGHAGDFPITSKSPRDSWAGAGARAMTLSWQDRVGT